MSDSDYEPEYEPETVTVLPAPSPLTVTVLTLIPPPLEYMSALHTSKTEVSSRVVWTGSLMLARHVLLTPSVRSSMFRRRVLELGAGTGLVGLAVCMSMKEEVEKPGAVCMTDGDQEVRGQSDTFACNVAVLSLLLFLTSYEHLLLRSSQAIKLLRQNAEMNGVNIGKGMGAGVPDKYLWGRDGVEEVREATPDDVTNASSIASRLAHRCLARRRSQLSGWCASHFGSGQQVEAYRFDVVLAGDVLYKEGLPGLFFQSVERTMTVGGALYLCHVPRAEVTHEVVLEAAEAAGMEVERVDKFGDGQGEMKVPEDAKEEDAVRARIYKITRKIR